MLAGVQVKHEIRQSSFELCAHVPVNRKARPGELDGSLQVENAEFRSQFPVRLWSEVKLWRRAPLPDFHIPFRAMADWNALMRHVGDSKKNLLQPRVEVGSSFLQDLNLLAQLFRLGDGSGCILARLFQLGNVLRGLVSPSLHSLRLGNSLATLRIDRQEIFQHGSRVGAALAQHFFHPGQVVTNKTQIEHGNSILYRKPCKECTQAPIAAANNPGAGRESNP